MVHYLIDYCEAFAIRDSLISLTNEIREINDNSVPLDQEISVLEGIKGILVISDSLTVLKWISGEYKIRSKSMKANFLPKRRK